MVYLMDKHDLSNLVYHTKNVLHAMNQSTQKTGIYNEEYVINRISHSPKELINCKK